MQKRIEELKTRPLSEDERKVMRVLYAAYKEGKGAVTQRQIAQSEQWLGSHPKFEDFQTSETTLRKVRQVIRDLRIKWNAPILSDREGYWMPKSEAEVTEYLARIEQEARAQASAWFETYKAMKSTFGTTSSFFEAMEGATIKV